MAEVVQGEGGVVHNLAAKSDAFWGEIAKTDRPLSDFDPDTHFLLRFHPTFLGERPVGYSGAGVWFPGDLQVKGELWTPILFSQEFRRTSTRIWDFFASSGPAL